MAERFEGGGQLLATSIYGARNRRGLVEIQLGETVVTVRPAEARAHAYNILACAEAAETDEFLVGWLMGLKGTDDPRRVLLVLREFREWRDAHREEEKDGLDR